MGGARIAHPSHHCPNSLGATQGIDIHAAPWYKGIPFPIGIRQDMEQHTESIKEAGPHIPWIDAARFTAIWLVILTHAREIGSVVPFALYDETPWLWKSVFNDIDRLGAPIFIIISGALILGRAAKMSVWAYYRKYARRIVQFAVLLVLYCILTNFVSRMALHGDAPLEALRHAVFVDNGFGATRYGEAFHIWYLYIAITLYLIAPFLGRMLKHLETREILLFLALAIVFGYAFPWVCIFGDTNDSVGVAVSMSQLFSPTINMLRSGMPGAFLVYFVLGYLLMHRNLVPEGPRSTRLAVAALAGSCLLATGVDALKGHHVYFLHWYSTSATILVGGFALAVLIRNLMSGATRLPGFVMAISRYSFGIYLSHYGIILAVLPWWQRQPAAQNPMVSCLFYTAAGFSLSILLVWLLSKSRCTRFLVA